MHFTHDNHNKVPTVSSLDMVRVDTLMVDTYHIALLQMMENAGRNLADVAETYLRKDLSLAHGAIVTVLVGPGGNGGGGLVAARHLHNRGYIVQIISAVPPGQFAPVTDKQAIIVTALGLSMNVATSLPESDLVLDCLLGYSLTENPRGSFATLITEANTSPTPILSLDTPSGLDVTTGQPQTPCIKATATMTLALPKSGFTHQAARAHLGQLSVADISVPPTLYSTYMTLDVPPDLFATKRVVPLTVVA